MTNTKLEALKAYLIAEESFTEEEVADARIEGEYATICGWEYKVYTEEEADKVAREYILDSLWAFNPRFILEHTEFYRTCSFDEELDFIECIKEMQNRLCESATPIIRALISDIDKFVARAIREDGRGHFISFYDGEEVELDGGFYAYREC